MPKQNDEKLRELINRKAKEWGYWSPKQEKIIKNFILSIVKEVKPVEKAREIRYPGTSREEEWIRIR